MAWAAGAQANVFLEILKQVGTDGSPGRSKAAENSGQHCDEKSETRNVGIDGDSIDAWHGLGKQWHGGAQSKCRQSQTEEATCKTQHETFADALAENRARVGSECEANGMLTAAPDCADEKQDRYIGAGDKQHNTDGQKQRAEQRAYTGNDGLAQGENIPADVDRGQFRGEIAHDLLRDPICIVRGLLHGDTVLQARDEVRSPCASGWGKLVSAETHGHPQLRLADAAGKQREFEAARHHANDGVVSSVESDRGACDVGIAVKAIKPQCVADHSNGCVRVVFLVSKDTAERGSDVEYGEDASGEARAVHRFRERSARELPRCRDVGTHRGEGLSRMFVGRDLECSNS